MNNTDTCQKPYKYNCELCDFNANKFSDWARHISTKKHKNISEHIEKREDQYVCVLCDVGFTDVEYIKLHKISNEHKTHACNKECIKEFKCEFCDKIYKSNSGLIYHKIKCCNKPENDNSIQLSNINDINNMMQQLLKQNNELQQKIIELANEPRYIMNNNTTNNNNFNLNVFLNEHCKNAMTLEQFVESMNVTMNDLIETGRLGFVNGISRIFINELKKLDITERPIHCTDLKRESLYIKENEQWIKDNENKDKMVKAVNKTIEKNLTMIPVWVREHPNYGRNDDQMKEYINISLSAIGPPGNDESMKHKHKIIKNVLKTAVIDKCIEFNVNNDSKKNQIVDLEG